MSKELRTKKEGFVKELNSLTEKLKSEGRAQFSADEKAAFDKLKSDLQGINDLLSAFEIQEAEATAEAERALKTAPATKRSNDQFGNFLKELRNGKIEMPIEEFEKRATVTTSSNAQWKFTDMADLVPVNEPELVLESLGSKIAYFKEGNVSYPAMSHIMGTFGTEDNSVSDPTLTTSQTTLVPTFVSASIEVSKVFIASSKKKNIDDLKNALVYGLKKANEKRGLAHAVASSGTTGTPTGTTSYERVLTAESFLIGEANGLIAGKNAVKRLKKEKVDAGSAQFTMMNNEVNGVPAKRSILLDNNANNGILYGDFSTIVQAYFGDGITIEVITDGTMARKGNVLIIASALADAKCVDYSKMSYFISA